ncbi:MAG: tetratricopeptide repeat protein [Candidatus Eremiobacteraeota bacterium]|nr:tetratricopeptide repeat protein [Candidatus Eremiobacteraeota bacterium]
MEVPTIQTLNQRAATLNAQGRFDEALEVLEQAVAQEPADATLRNNLATVLDRLGKNERALSEYREALRLDPSCWAAHLGIANALVRQGDYPGAEDRFQAALQLRPTFVPALLSMYELAQVRGDRTAALEYQERALQQQRLYSTIAPQERRRVLALLRPGDWQANIPVDLLFNAETTTLHKFYIIDRQIVPPEDLPPYDVVFNCIGESDEAGPALMAAKAFIASQKKPVLNDPDSVLRTGRLQLQQYLEYVDANVPRTKRVARGDLVRRPLPLDFPFIIRPVGSHAGRSLSKIESDEELKTYLAGEKAGEFFVSDFVDYARSDGFYRKYRIVMIDGQPFPFHLGISANWMIHYYNAPMREHEWMRAEERQFLASFDEVFNVKQRAVLQDIARALGLQYFAIDCSIDKDGRLVIFEADPAVIVHVIDPVELFAYKHEHVPRIFAAVEAMVDKRIAGPR